MHLAVRTKRDCARCAACDPDGIIAVLRICAPFAILRTRPPTAKRCLPARPDARRNAIWIAVRRRAHLINATHANAREFPEGLAKADYCTEVTRCNPHLDPVCARRAILFSDISTVPDAMGLGLYFVEGEGPKFERARSGEAEGQHPCQF